MNKPIRILMVTGILDRGGAETMIMNMYRHIDRSKVQFDFVEHSLIPGAYDEEIQSLGGRIYHRSRLNGLNYFEYVKWWNKFFDDHPEYHVVHGHIESMSAVYLSIAKKHHLYTIAHSHNTSEGLTLKQLIFNVVTYKTRYIADNFFACSMKAGEDRYGSVFDIAKPNCKIFYNAIKIRDFAYNPEYRKQIRREFGIDENTLLLGHVGRFRKEKNHELLVEIYKEIIKDRQNTKMIFVGDGPLFNMIREKVKNEGLENGIIFAGMRADVNRIMCAMDVLLLPSSHEGLPVTIVEAQASGLPCIISDRVPTDCIVFDELVQFQLLTSSPGEWAYQALKSKTQNRSIDAKVLADRGFDVESAAKWLERFYIEKYEQ